MAPDEAFQDRAQPRPAPKRAGTVPALSVRNIAHAYDARRVLDDVSLAVPAGRFTALLGPNGAGKTTLFGLVAGLLGLQSGEIEICGIAPALERVAALRRMGLVFQQPTLDLDLTVMQNLDYFAALRGIDWREGRRRGGEELERLDMAERADERVRNLNGGHRRRAEIARALLDGPSLLVLDEPTVGLDVESRRRIVDYVHDLAESRGVAVLWATHLIDEIRPEDDLIVLHQGRVARTGRTAEIVAQTGTESLAAAYTRLTGRTEGA